MSLARLNYRRPTIRSGFWQIGTSVIPYLCLWGAMVWSLQVSYWLTLGLSPLAAGFLIRIFIIFHDSGHGSFFPSRRANRVTEFLTGVLTLTPYRQWRLQHAQHHATSGDLDRRGFGDVWTMTVQEYLRASRGERLAYRLARNPFILFGIAPLYVFLIRQRLPARDVGRREHWGVLWTNCALTALAVGLALLIGLKALVLIQIPILVFAGAAGIWLFYVQHQFERVYWARNGEWEFSRAALEGSSFYRLPRVLQWFSGNIGFHHIHHLNPRIPNYGLEDCHRSHSIFQEVPTITLKTSLRSLRFHLWDEDSGRMVSFKALQTY